MEGFSEPQGMNCWSPNCSLFDVHVYYQVMVTIYGEDLNSEEGKGGGGLL